MATVYMADGRIIQIPDWCAEDDEYLPSMVNDYLKLPYKRMIIPDQQSGTYTGMIAEFPGCIAQGNTPQEAYESLEETAKSWIEAALDLGQEIPLPSMEPGEDRIRPRPYYCKHYGGC